ncbi:MAG: hypothetical protein M3O46_15745, partial [Myxococcota bacterium]|nr:hypothetical protein [Myxococcota bacterium]
VRTLIDAVVCAAAEALDVSPRAVRPALLAAFARASELGLTLERSLEGLRRHGPTAPRAEKTRPPPQTRSPR